MSVIIIIVVVAVAPIGILIGSPEEIGFRLLLRRCLRLLRWHNHVTIDAQQTRNIVGLSLLLLLFLQEFWKQWKRLSFQALLFNLLLLSFEQGNLLRGVLNESIVLLLVAKRYKD